MHTVVSAWTHVFAYGSLMSPASLAETLPDFEFELYPPVGVCLRGWQRAFSAIFPNSRSFRATDGSIPPKVAYLNLEPIPDAVVPGVVLRVSSDQFARLAERESGYASCDVTDSVFPLSGQGWSGGRCVAFVVEHTERETAAADGLVGLGADYIALLGRVCAELDRREDTDCYARDFERLCQRYAGWPRLTGSNPRTGNRYP